MCDSLRVPSSMKKKKLHCHSVPMRSIPFFLLFGRGCHCEKRQNTFRVPEQFAAVAGQTTIEAKYDFYNNTMGQVRFRVDKSVDASLRLECSLSRLSDERECCPSLSIIEPAIMSILGGKSHFSVPGSDLQRLEIGQHSL